MQPELTTPQQQQLLKAAIHAESLLDEEIDRLSRMQTEDYELLREKRHKMLKLEYQQQQLWRSKGHGTYSEVPDQVAWFEACKQSRNVVCHFYRDSTMRCGIVDKHLSILAEQHPETRFIKINAEKSPFLTQRLGVYVLPTILLLQDGETRDKLEGFEKLGNKDNFTTKTLESYIRSRGLFRKESV